ncbi:MAG: tryptophan synthase subunit alpha [Candidatus Lambdaproteobacteria bacterium]|nr:tryptophan synthase subunit alpha [Candidatus Lambdaproteobacteria bacterium]
MSAMQRPVQGGVQGGSRGTARLAATFGALRGAGRKALVLYLMAGDPSPAFTEQAVPRLAESGADVIELGLPFSDPVADGPVIQAAGQRAIRHISDVPAFLALVRAIRRRTAVPLVTMTYYNPVFRYGEQPFIAAALEAGLDGAIVPDLPLVEAGSWRALCLEAGLAAIFLEAPNTTPAHARELAEATRGFLYLVSLKGVTGAERGLGENLGERIARLRGWVETPLMVGFGISTPAQARQFGAAADGIIVGSGLIARMESAPADPLGAAVAYTRELRAALDSIGG